MSKLINVSDDVYKELKKRKGIGSFSEELRKLLMTKNNKEQLLSHFGKGGIDENSIQEIQKGWKRWTQKYA